ncbi:hypothetical protein [Deinococcus gobiensis]|uniref:Uncharacterized protein n=1 Tax=Deinococcus gobiensis (strain DSM 21396 / JCM 16679 / CGMCC 1.7299 / I-0) TaxID=745776 RepID=H8H331_DEIGI|nr:hypothetical protein [Deinococcus gobiensis]AFD27928.1 hypothetical protein DGo_PC0136 [Deinococcus gobiensis I-0]
MVPTPTTDLPTLQRQGSKIQTERQAQLRQHLITLTTHALLEYEQQTGRAGATGQAVQYRRYNEETPRRLLDPRLEVLIEDATGLHLIAEVPFGDLRSPTFLDPVTREELYLSDPETISLHALKGKQGFHLKGVAQTQLVYGPRFGLSDRVARALQSRQVWLAPGLLVMLLTISNALTFSGTVLGQHVLLVCTTFLSVVVPPLMFWWGFRPQRQQLKGFSRTLLRRFQGQPTPTLPALVNRQLLGGVVFLALILSGSHHLLAGSLVQALSLFVTWLLIRFFHLQAEQQGRGLAEDLQLLPMVTPESSALYPLSLTMEERLELLPKIAQLQTRAEEAQEQVGTSGLGEPQYRALSAVQRDWPESVNLIATLPPQYQAEEAAKHLDLLLDITPPPAANPAGLDPALAAHLTYLQELSRNRSHRSQKSSRTAP